jgi:hypothetical protein
MRQDKWEQGYLAWKEAKKKKAENDEKKIVEEKNKIKQFDFQKKEEVEEAKNLNPFQIEEIMDSRKRNFIWLLLLIVAIILVYVFWFN